MAAHRDRSDPVPPTDSYGAKLLALSGSVPKGAFRLPEDDQEAKVSAARQQGLHALLARIGGKLASGSHEAERRHFSPAEQEAFTAAFEAARAPSSQALCGYHVTDIPKGVLGEPSKVVEEAAELADAHQQGVGIMALVEAADLYGALRAYLAQHHPGKTMADLEAMADVTERAFRNGRR